MKKTILYEKLLLPKKCSLGKTIHPRLQLQTWIFTEWWDDEGEDQRKAHEESRQDHLGGQWQISSQSSSLNCPYAAPSESLLN